MSDEPATTPDPPETTAMLLSTFADLYRHEVSAVEDVHRTLPFFGNTRLPWPPGQGNRSNG